MQHAGAGSANWVLLRASEACFWPQTVSFTPLADLVIFLIWQLPRLGGYHAHTRWGC